MITSLFPSRDVIYGRPLYINEGPGCPKGHASYNNEDTHRFPASKQVSIISYNYPKKLDSFTVESNFSIS